MVPFLVGQWKVPKMVPGAMNEEGPSKGHLQILDLLALSSGILDTLCAVQFEDRRHMNLPDALLDRSFFLPSTGFSYSRLRSSP